MKLRSQITLLCCCGLFVLPITTRYAITPVRVISLKPNITEILFALGLGDRVIGVTTWCDYPLEVRKLPKVADYININTEKIIALQPDIVIGSEENSVREPFAVLNNAGIRSLLVPFRTIEDLYDSIQKIADTVGVDERGKKLVTQIKSEIQSLDLRTYPLRPTRLASLRAKRERSEASAPTHLRTVLILVGHHPLVAAGPGTFYGEVLKLIGAQNIVTGTKIPYPTLSTEFILAQDPDIIIDLAMGSEEARRTCFLTETLCSRVRSFNIFDFRAGPRLSEAVKKLRNLF